MRVWLAILLIIFGVVAARAISPAQQIIIFGGNSSASGGSGTSCASTGILDLSNVCNDIYFIGALK
jgi:hypothetical protein